MRKVESVYADPNLKSNTACWEALLDTPVLENRDIRENISYRLFYFFIEVLEKDVRNGGADTLPADAVGIFSDYFDWKKNRNAMIAQYGATHVDMVMDYFNQDITPKHEPSAVDEPVPAAGPARLPGARTLFPGLAIATAFIFTGLYIFVASIKNYESDVPYYPCRILFTERSSAADFTDCEALANTGDTHAKLLFGLANIFSPGIPAEPQKALLWIERSATANNPRAMFLLGALNSDDLDVAGTTLRSANVNDAVYWLEKAASAGESHANLYLAALYLLSPELENHALLARNRLADAVSDEVPLAYLAMALFDLYGIAGERDPGLAKNWLDLYARSSIPEGANEVAWLLSTTENTGLVDKAQAIQYIPLLAQNREHEEGAMYIDTIAAVYAANGDFNKATREQEQAIEMLNTMEASVYEANIEGFRERLDRFKAGLAWTEPMTADYLATRLAGIQNQLISREMTRVIVDTGSYAPAISSNTSQSSTGME